MKKLFRFLVKFTIAGLFILMVLVFGLTLFYRRNFPVNTWINGVYCTGKSVEQVNEELINSQQASVVYVVDDEDVSWEIDMQDAGIRPDYTVALNSYIDHSDIFYWFYNLQTPVAREIAAEYIIDDEKLSQCFEALPFVAEENGKEKGVSICYDNGGYLLRDDNQGRLNTEKAYAYLKDCLSKGQRFINLKSADCYEDLADSADDKIQREIWRQLRKYIDNTSKIVYDMGAEQIYFTEDIAIRFLETEADGCPTLDKSGNIIISEEKVQEWVEQLALAYNTCDTEKDFAATRGDTVKVKYVTYGTKLDMDAEKAYLSEILQTELNEMQVHVPIYGQQGYVRGLDDIGGTYIEVDMTEQKLYYYVNGELVLESEIVTGNTGRRMGTPEGINFVYAKQRNRTLRGPGYASFVKYWMPVKGNVGIHDAGWRSKFGGEIYKTNGSHGCINMPRDIAGELYEKVEIGTPVIMFY